MTDERPTPADTINRLEREVAWLRERLEWRDIASAPRDDSLILLWNGVEVTGGARWEGGWADWMHDWMDPQPSHWLPLPEAPEASDGR